MWRLKVRRIVMPTSFRVASFGVNLCKFARYSRWDVRCECEVYLVGHFCVIHDTFCVRVSMVQHDGKFWWRHRLGDVGLAVWFSLWVREVPGSTPGRPRLHLCSRKVILFLFLHTTRLPAYGAVSLPSLIFITSLTIYDFIRFCLKKKFTLYLNEVFVRILTSYFAS